MPPSDTFPSPAPLAGPHRELGLRIDGGGHIVAVDGVWPDLAERYGVDRLRPDRLTGLSVFELLSDDAADEMRRFLAAALGADDVPSPLGDRFGPWNPWPVDHLGVPAVAFRAAPGIYESWVAALRRPLFTVDPAGRLEPLGRAARLLQQHHPEMQDERTFAAWLRPYGYRARRVATWRPWGRALVVPSQDSLHAYAPFQVLARTLRAALHDLSNPLAAVRMVAEVAGRGLGDPTKHLRGVASHLDTVSATLTTLRSLVQTDLRSVPLDAIALVHQAVDLLTSELERRGVGVDLSGLQAPEPELEASRGSFVLLALGLLLHRLGDAVDGDVLTLSSTQDDDSWTVDVRLRAGGGARSLLPDPFVDAATLRALAAPLEGRVDLDHTHGEAFELGPILCLRLPL